MNKPQGAAKMNKVIHIRVTDDEHAQLTTIAHNKWTSISKIFRPFVAKAIKSTDVLTKGA